MTISEIAARFGMNKVPISVRRLKKGLDFAIGSAIETVRFSFKLLRAVIHVFTFLSRPADLDRKYHIYHYRHIFVYLLKHGKREGDTLQP
jgi:hypothetical protein